MLTRLRRELLADPNGTVALIRRVLAEHGSIHGPHYLLSLGYMAVGAFCMAAMTYLFGYGANETYVHRSFSGAALVWLLVIAVFALKGAASYGQSVTLARISSRIIADNQRRIFDKLIRQDVAFFGNRHSSEFASRLTFGAASPALVLDLLMNALGRDLLTLISLTGIMMVQAPIPSLVTFLLVPPAILGVRRVLHHVRDVVLTQFAGGTDLLQTMQEMIQGFRIIKAFNLEASVRAQAYESIAIVERASNRLAGIANESIPLMEMVGGVFVAVMFLSIGYRMVLLDAGPGEFVSFIGAFLLAYEPAKRIAQLKVSLHDALTGVRVLFELLDLPDQRPATPKPDAKVERGRIEFDRVSFAYRADNPVLQQVSFVAQPGEVTAFVGVSGGGKSTIFNLVLALYAPERGSIRVDGQDYHELCAESIRRQIAYVGQDVFLFHGTVGYNIGLGRPGATEAEIVAAARAAHAHDFILQFPGGYDTQVGELGAQMSGGQRQRIAIARALMRNAPIILLDEPTAALDTESESFVRGAMAELIKGRTTLVIAHRLYTITHADMIHVVENGMIVESGRHAELLAGQGRYAQLYRLRFGDAERSGLHNEVSIISG